MDQRSFFSVSQYGNEFIQIISFLTKAYLNSCMRLLLELYCDLVVKHVVFINCENKNGIHIYQYIFELLHFLSGSDCGVGFEQKIFKDLLTKRYR